MQQNSYSPNDYESEIRRLHTELKNIQSQVQTLTNNEVRDQAEINRLKMLITDYEQQSNSSRRQLE
jgi:peptidoglycan hydrolase CwlO-like protein